MSFFPDPIPDDLNINDNLDNSYNQSSDDLSKSKHIIKSNYTSFNKSKLPIDESRSHILSLVSNNRVVIITGDTGSGKSTQLAQFLYQDGYSKYGMIGITQPRRVGAVSVARRVAEEMNVKLGEEVGYTVRFEDCTSKNTKIRFLTDGCLLRECLFHPNLEPYSIIILDEAHERSLQTDILFGIIREILTRRNNVKFIITSATLDASHFSQFFHNCPTFHVAGRCYPVDISYAIKTEKRFYVDKAVEHAIRIHVEEPLGDILVFLTGEEEIQRACRLMGQKVDMLDSKGIDMPDICILAAYASLSAQLQQQVFQEAPPNCRKVIFSTNICETSLTVNGVVYVIDCGYVKQRIFNPMTGMDSLVIVPISQVQAVQRTGRAGRTRAGKCIRLYSKESFEIDMPPKTEPEIKRTNLANMEFGIEDPLAFKFLDPPEPELIIEALQELFWLGAIDAHGALTSLGKSMGQFPLEPALSKMLMSGIEIGCWEDIVSVAAMMAVENLFDRPSNSEQSKLAEIKHKQFFTQHGDHINMLFIYDSYMSQSKKGFADRWCSENYLQVKSIEKARSVRQELVDIITKHHRNAINKKILKSESSVDLVRRAIAMTYYYHAARKTGERGRYKPINNDGSLANSIFIHPNSSLILSEPKWVVYTDLMVTSKPFMKAACSIDFDWIKDLLTKLKETNVYKLTGRKVIPTTLVVLPPVDPEILKKREEERKLEEQKLKEIELGKRKQIEETVSDAKLRYLQRKANK